MAFADARFHGQDVRLTTHECEEDFALPRRIEMTTQVVTYREAIVAAMREEMRRDQKTLIMGEDIGESGGPFKTCQGLYEELGAARVRDTPIAETGFVGAALGLALTGYRPIVEIMFADFLGLCFYQTVNSIP